MARVHIYLLALQGDPDESECPSLRESNGLTQHVVNEIPESLHICKFNSVFGGKASCLQKSFLHLGLPMLSKSIPNDVEPVVLGRELPRVGAPARYDIGKREAPW